MRARKSPILDQIAEMQKPEGQREEVRMTDEQQWEICWQFTHPIADVKAAFSKSPEELAKLAEEFGDTESPQVMDLLLRAVIEQLRRTYETALSYAQEAKEGAQIDFFRDSGETPATG